MRKRSKNFSLIEFVEFLVLAVLVWFIVSILVSTASLAGLRAQDAQVRHEMTELRTLFWRELSDTGSYTGLKNGGAWKATGSTCTREAFSGIYAEESALICDKLVRATGKDCRENCVYFESTADDTDTSFSIMAYLPYESSEAGSPRYLCMGSSGNQSMANATTWMESGCYGAP